MAEGALSLKLRCASWQQLATIYKRDLRCGTMFPPAAPPPLVGTTVRIDLTLPSATVIELYQGDSPDIARNRKRDQVLTRPGDPNDPGDDKP